MATTDSPTRVGAFEAKTHLSELLQRVEAGERLIITKHGRDVAQLVPVVESTARRDWSEFWEQVDARSRSFRVRTSIKADVEAGRM